MKYLVICMLGMISLNAHAIKKDCFCKFQTGTNWANSGGILVKDWGKISEETIGVGANSAENKCKAKCSSSPYGAAYNWDGANSNTLRGWACSAGVPSGQKVHAISKAGLIPSGSIDHTMGKVQRTAAVYNCPQGGSLNYQSMTMVPSCVETVPSTLSCPNGYWLEAQISKCVKQACPPNSMPGSPNWAAIGAGSMGGINGEYKTDDQDGSRFFINAARTCPAGFQLNGVNCVKSYAANLVSAATCTLVSP
jgi:hypothetical protein